jgi:hypothetical protein
MATGTDLAVDEGEGACSPQQLETLLKDEGRRRNKRREKEGRGRRRGMSPSLHSNKWDVGGHD